MNKKAHSNLGGNTGSAHPNSMAHAIEGMFKKKNVGEKKSATPRAGKRKQKR